MPRQPADRRQGCTLVSHNPRDGSRFPDLNIENWH
jgi:predicted nucleic acid-binding protein